jgi:hypothetical protein
MRPTTANFSHCNFNESYNDDDDNNNNNNNVIIINSIKLFIYLRAELNSQWSITESASTQTATAMRQRRAKHT